MKTGHVLGKQDSWSPYGVNIPYHVVSIMWSASVASLDGHYSHKSSPMASWDSNESILCTLKTLGRGNR